MKAREQRAIVVSSPESVKSVLLKYIDLLLLEREACDDIQAIEAAAAAAEGSEAASNHTSKEAAAIRALRLVPQLRKRMCERGEHADVLRDVLQLWGPDQRGVLLLDEVDMLLHPLKSELNFPIGTPCAGWQ